MVGVVDAGEKGRPVYFNFASAIKFNFFHLHCSEGSSTALYKINPLANQARSEASCEVIRQAESRFIMTYYNRLLCGELQIGQKRDIPDVMEIFHVHIVIHSQPAPLITSPTAEPLLPRAEEPLLF
jgi:hypothetical protein